jgi:hypothetical protein
LIKYYTDWHDVDEDVKAITHHGRYWGGESYAGITQRGVRDNPTDSQDSVAYKNNHTLSLTTEECVTSKITEC